MTEGPETETKHAGLGPHPLNSDSESSGSEDKSPRESKKRRPRYGEQKVCKTCNIEKTAGVDFDKQQHRCKQCVLDKKHKCKTCKVSKNEIEFYKGNARGACKQCRRLQTAGGWKYLPAGRIASIYADNASELLGMSEKVIETWRKNRNKL